MEFVKVMIALWYLWLPLSCFGAGIVCGHGILVVQAEQVSEIVTDDDDLGVHGEKERGGGKVCA